MPEEEDNRRGNKRTDKLNKRLDQGTEKPLQHTENKACSKSHFVIWSIAINSMKFDIIL